MGRLEETPGRRRRRLLAPRQARLADRLAPPPTPPAGVIPVLAYARTAEIALEFLRKGTRAIVEGRLHEERWKPPHASERSRHVVVAERVTSLEIPRANSAPPADPHPSPIEVAAAALDQAWARTGPRL